MSRLGMNLISPEVITENQAGMSQEAGPGDFVRGMRAGTYGMGSSLANTGGALANAFGADQAAEGMYGMAQQLQGRAQATGPRIASLAQLEQAGYTPGNMIDYAQGVLGNTVPSAAVGMIPGMMASTPLRALAAATAAYTPMEMGDVVGKMREDNGGQPLTVEDTLQAAGTGIASAGLQSVVPAVVGAKVAGRALGEVGRAAPQSLARTMGQNVVGGGLMEGATEGGGEVVKQLGAGYDNIDWNQVKENAVAGLIGGGGMGIAGGAGDYVHSRADKIGGAFTGAKERMGQMAGNAQTKVADTLGDIPGDIKAKSGDVWEAVRAGAAGAFEGFNASDLGKTLNERAASIKTKVDDIMADEYVPEDIKQKVAAAAKNMGDKANQAFIWGVDKARKARDAVKDVADSEKSVSEQAVDAFGKVAEKAKDKLIDLGDPFLGDKEAFAAAAPDVAAAMLKDSDGQKTEILRARAKKLSEREDLADAERELLDEIQMDPVNDFDSKSGAVAGIGVRKNAKDKISELTGNLRSMMKRRKDEYETPGFDDEVTDVEDKSKKSEDLTGFHRVIAEDIAGLLPEGIPERDIVELGQMISKVIRSAAHKGRKADEVNQATGMRKLLGLQLDNHTRHAIDEVAARLGDQAMPVMEAIAKRIAAASPKDAENIWKIMQAVNERSGGERLSLRNDLVGMIDENNSLGLGEAELDELLPYLTRWAQGADGASSKEQYDHAKVRGMINTLFGKKANKAFARLEQDAMKYMKDPAQQFGGGKTESKFDADKNDWNDEEGGELRGADATGEVQEAVDRYIGAKDKDGRGRNIARKDVASAEHDAENISGLLRSVEYNRRGGPDSVTARRMEQAKADFPGHNTSFVTLNDYRMQTGRTESEVRQAFGLKEFAGTEDQRNDWEAKEGLGTYGYLKVTGQENDDTGADAHTLRAVSMDTKNHGDVKHPSRLVFGTEKGQKGRLIADAVKITDAFNRKMAYDAVDDISPLHRRARAFMAGYGALAERYGTAPTLDDTTVIGYRQGGGTITVADVKALKWRPDDSTDWLQDNKVATTMMDDSVSKMSATHEQRQGVIRKAADGVDKMDTAFVDQVRASLAQDADNGKFWSKAAYKEEFKSRLAALRKGSKTYQNFDKVLRTVTQVDEMAAKSDQRTKDLTDESRLETDPDRDVITYLRGTENTPSDKIRRVSTDGSFISHAGSDKNVNDFTKQMTSLRAAMDNLRAKATDDITDADRARMKTMQATFKELAMQNGLFTESGAGAYQKQMGSAIDSWVENRLSRMPGGDKDRKTAINSFVQRVATDARNFAAAAAEGNMPAVMARRLRDVLFSNPEKGVANKATDVNEMLTSLREMAEEEGYATVPKAKPKAAPKAEGSPDPKGVAAKKAAFLKKAVSGDKALIEELSKSNDLKGLQRALAAVGDVELTAGLESTIDAINARINELTQDPAVAYHGQTVKYSAERNGPSNFDGPFSPINGKEVLDYIRKTLGDQVQVAFANIMHSGDFRTNKVGEHILRVSVHSLNPMSVAYHESLHSFFQRLKEMGRADVVKVLEDAMKSDHVLDQLKTLLAHSPEATKQLSDMEERAAYAYQFWMSGQLKLAPAPKSLFSKIAAAFRKVLGMWTNDQRAEHIFRYFSSGGFAPASTSNSSLAVHSALMKPGRNFAAEALKSAVEPLARLGDAVVGVGGVRLRETGIPALRELADQIQVLKTAEGSSDEGFLPASRQTRTRLLNKLATYLKDSSAENVDEAMEALQNGKKAASVGGRIAQTVIRKFLKEALDDMRAAGMKVGDLGPNYFPRVWDPLTISKNQDAFLAMLARNNLNEDVMHHLMAHDGSEVMIDFKTDRPGMLHAKERMLNVSAADAAPFLKKDFWNIMNGYVTQMSRRMEWANRFGDDSKKFNDLMKQARKEGATDKQLELAQDYVDGVNGTLGEDVNPTWRRLQSNMIMYQNIRLLPAAIFAQFVDPVGIVVRGGTVKDGFDAFKRGLFEMRKSWQKDPKYDAATELATTLNVIEDVALRNSLSSVHGVGMMEGKLQHLNDQFFRYNFVEGYNQSMRVAGTQAAIRFVMRHASLPSQHSKRWLDEIGLKPSDIKVVNGELAMFERDGLTPAQATKMKNAINRWVDGAVLRPNAADKTIWMSDPHFAIIAHMKQFIFSFHQTILKRILHEVEHGNYTPVLAAASYVPIMLAADMAKQVLVNGGDEPEWKKNWGASDYLGHAVARSGLLGVGQFAVDSYQNVQHGGMGISPLLGPTLEQMVEGVNVLAGTRQFDKFVMRSMPANVLYKDYFKDDTVPYPEE
jgi:hypothetical protein